MMQELCPRTTLRTKRFKKQSPQKVSQHHTLQPPRKWPIATCLIYLIGTGALTVFVEKAKPALTRPAIHTGRLESLSFPSITHSCATRRRRHGAPRTPRGTPSTTSPVRSCNPCWFYMMRGPEASMRIQPNGRDHNLEHASFSRTS